MPTSSSSPAPIWPGWRLGPRPRGHDHRQALRPGRRRLDGAPHGDGRRVTTTLLGPLAVLLEQPDASAVLSDFDGTLSPIVADPAVAYPLPEAPGVLGRPGPAVRRGGGGLGPSGVVPGPAPGRGGTGAAAVRRLRARVDRGRRRRSGPRGRAVAWARWPRWRPRPGPSSRAKRWGSRTKASRSRCTGVRRPTPAARPGLRPGWSRRTGLVLQPGRMAVEFRPPVDIDKGVGGRAPGARLRRGVLRR